MKLHGLIAIVLASVVLLGTSSDGQAESNNRVVVELFTSQGCSSCPPADALLHRLAQRRDVLPLALHVDYWDYIGWADNFARPEHTLRQKAYAHVAGSRTIYTPQMVIGGMEQIVGARPMEVADAVMEHRNQGPGVDLVAERHGDAVRVRAQPPGTSVGTLIVQLVRYSPEQVVQIKRGENAGKTLSYINIVTSWEIVEEWSGAASLDLEIPVQGDDAAAVILQQVGNGRIVAAVDLP